MTVKEKPTQETVEVSNTLTSNLAIQRLFNAIDSDADGYITINEFWQMLENVGILKDDPRIKSVNERFKAVIKKTNNNVSSKEFSDVIKHFAIVKKAITGNLAIPNWNNFTKEIIKIYNDTKPNMSGKVADYIPQLARVSSKNFAISICTVDGQRFSHGDFNKRFCLQSTCKPINYCIAHEELGEAKVHQHIGREPSGRSFNEMALNNDGLPHNPLINSGAIMCSSLIQRNLDIADRFDHVLNTWQSLSGGIEPTFNNSVYLSERQTADRNFALAYFMRENKAFPPKTDIIDTLEFYFQCCSIELTSPDMASAAATLANGGCNPLSGERVFAPTTVKNALSLMNSCGMYDFSGEFAFKIGFPAKSGVSGALLVVIPNVMGICIWSPNLDDVGNSSRGVELCKRLGETFNFHNYDSLENNAEKIDPRKKKFESKLDNVISLIWAAANGDLDEIQRLEALGVNLDASDYDGRTAIHLAASEGHANVVDFLLNKGAKKDPVDRFGGTPLQDAKKGKHKKVISLLNCRS